MDHGCHAPILNAGPFVIVAPESVIPVVSVKSKMTTEHLWQGIDNLASVAPLDLTFRKGLTFPATGRLLPAIAKFLLFFSQPDSHNSMLRNGAETVRTAVRRQGDIEGHLVQSMRAVDPFRGQDPMWDEARRVLPRHIAVIEPGPANYVQGWGPPEDQFASKTYGGGMRRVPWLYRHESRLPTAFEKFVYFLLTSVFHWLASPALSLLSAWGDLNPAAGARAGDIEEIIEFEGAALLEVSADTLPPVDG